MLHVHDNLHLGDSQTWVLLSGPVEVCDNLFITSTVPFLGLGVLVVLGSYLNINGEKESKSCARSELRVVKFSRWRGLYISLDIAKA